MSSSTVLVFSSLVLGMTSALPQDMPVVRPNHYLQQGTFAKEQHILPQSFYTPHHHPQQVQNLESDQRRSASSDQPQQQVAPANFQKPTDTATPPASSSGSSNEFSSPHGPSDPPRGGPNSDSYLNIGGASGGIASTLTNTHEYGETVPKAFSTLQQDSYAYYHGQNN